MLRPFTTPVQRSNFHLRNLDLTTAQHIAVMINRTVGNIAKATDPRIVQLDLTNRDAIDTLILVENLRVEPDNAAIVIIDEASGTIVMGANVRISPVAIAQGNLAIRVTEMPEVSQPDVFSRGTTVTTPRTSVEIDDQHGHAA